MSDTVIATSVVVGAEWKQIDVHPPILTDRDINIVNIEPMPPFKFGPTSKEIRTVDGVKFLPEVEVIMEDGRIIPLNHSGARFYRDHNFVSFKPADRFDIGLKISAIRLRSPEHFEVRAVWWSSYNVKDLP